MAISEAARSDLYNGLRDVIGPERTETLMSAIAWHTVDEVATKGDLAELRADMASLEARLIRTMTNWMVTILVAVIGAIVGVAFLV